MAPRRLSLRTTALVLAGVAGVVLAHALDYLLIIRSPAQRAAELARTGHGWWPSAVAAGVVSAGLALVLATARGAAGAVFRRAAESASATVGRDLGWMALWQTSLFATLEVFERIGAHRSPVELLHGPLFAVGLLLQVGVAVAVVGLLRGIERGTAAVAETVLAGRRSPGRARRRVFGASPLPVVGGGNVFGRHEARGPPLSLAA
ncbi:MAG TPA: hypothetical protein VHT97_07535 [Acidimicrobiales bacterium]|jgi:hypothetical protein|nr:hypothetical protein [Acidimicrobiales bacterium]